MPQVPPGKTVQPAQPRLSVRWSSQYGKIVQLWSNHGRQVFVKALSLVVNWALPLDERLMLVKVPQDVVYEKGSGTVVITSSPWLPTSVVPGAMLPLPVVIEPQGPGVGVGVGLAVGVGVGDGNGTFPAAWIKTGIGEPVLKKPTVPLVGFGGWSASNRKLYSVPKRIALA